MAGPPISALMDRYAVIGNPVAHSLSPEIHQIFATQTGERLCYEKLPAPQTGFREIAESFFAAGGLGLNVTLPFKVDAFDWVDETHGAALRAGSVNTIKLEDGNTHGFSTDGEGLVADLRALGIEVAGRDLLVLGAGGAVQAVLPSLIDAGARRLVVANRTAAKARALADRYPGPVESRPLEALAPGFDLVINGTAAGLQGTGALIDERIVRDLACYDMLYARDGDTPFCRWATAAGAATVADGLGMLVEQAGAAFAIWRGVHPETRAALKRLREPVAVVAHPERRGPAKQTHPLDRK